MRPKPERPWVRMLPGNGDGHLHGLCLGCAVPFVVGLPAPLEIVPRIMDLYLRAHGRCGGQWEKRGKPTTLPDHEIRRV